MGDSETETRKIQTREEYVHHSELAGALEAYRDEEMSGSIVAARYPSESKGRVKLTWARLVPVGDSDD